MSNYHNIYYYYGRDDYSADGEAQLENNTTKALINTLQHSSPQITSRFLSEIFDQKIHADEFGYILQADPASSDLGKIIHKADKLYILVLTPSGKSVSTSLAQNAGKFITQVQRNSIDQEKINKFIKEIKSICLKDEFDNISKSYIKKRFPKINIDSLMRDDIFDLYDFYIRKSLPDAWIFWNKSVALIENKTRTEANESQLKRHKQLLGRYNKSIDPIILIKSWRKHVSPALINVANSTPQQLLVRQLIGYLEAINMGELKFTYDDFLAFDELDAGQVRQIRSAHERIYNLGEKMIETVLPNHRVHKQNIQANYAGINLVSNDFSDKKPFQVPHYSIAITGDLFLTVFVTFESKPLITKLVKKYKKEKKALEYRLEEVLSNIKEENYYFRLLDKWHVTSGGRKQNRSTWYPLIDIPLDMLSSIPNWSKSMLIKIDSLSTNERKYETIDKITFLNKFGGKSVYAAVAVGRNFKWHNVHERKKT